MKALLNICAIFLVGLLSVLDCSAQGKKVDFVKTLEYSPVNYEVKNDTNFYLSSINWERDRSDRHYSKKIEFNPQGEPISFHLSCDVNLGYINLFWNAYYDNFGIDYTISDTIKETFSNIGFEFESDSLRSYSLQIEFNDENNTTHFFKLDSSLVAFYKNWLFKDVSNENTFKYPDFFNFSKFQIEKIRRHYISTVTVGDTTVRTQYFIDSSFQNSILNRDSLLLRQYKSFKIQIGNETISYLALVLPESVEIESYTYDSILKTTNQLMLLTHGNDTLYEVKLNTRLEGSNFISDYLIKGKHPIELALNPRRRSRTYPIFNLDTLKERSIHIIRDSTGNIIAGTGAGISSQGDTLESRLGFFPLYKQEGIELREFTTPNRIECHVDGKVEIRQYELISLYPNLDLRNLSKILLINANGIIGETSPSHYYVPNPSNGREFKNRKSMSYTKYVWKKTKKVKSPDLKGFHKIFCQNYRALFEVIVHCLQQLVFR